jgi:hypothetical protein
VTGSHFGKNFVNLGLSNFHKSELIMAENLPDFYFFLSHSHDDPKLPDSIGDFTSPKRKGKSGEYAWIMQTYLWLKDSDFPCHLVRELPDKGIVVTHREGLPYSYIPSEKQLLICIKGDQNPHPYAHIHIVQNPKEVQLPPIKIQSKYENRYLLPGHRFFIPLWPQPGLIERDPNRGDVFKRIAYFGITANLEPTLTTQHWFDQLANMNLEWVICRERDKWDDYSDVDAIVAIRRFNTHSDYSWKPASKLFNAWKAGVPAILSPESAYLSERKSELDFLEARNIDELISAIKKLQNDSDLRNRIIENGKLRSQEITPEKICQKWQNFLLDFCIPKYRQWIDLSLTQKRMFLFRRKLANKYAACKNSIF